MFYSLESNHIQEGGELNSNFGCDGTINKTKNMI